MTEQYNGGPAFPTEAGQVVYSHGMYLRDFFAGQALAGIMANPELNGMDCPEALASVAYQAADAMLAASGGDHG